MDSFGGHGFIMPVLAHNDRNLHSRSIYMAVVEILEIFSDIQDPKIAFTLSSPKPGDTIDTFALTISGTIYSRKINVTALDIYCNGLLKSSPINTPNKKNARGVLNKIIGRRNFNISISMLGLPATFELDVCTTLADGSTLFLSKIRGIRKPLRSKFAPTLHPLMVTALGRSGTTLLMSTLAEHPAIVVHKIHPYEVRVASYWMQMLKVLSAPHSPGKNNSEEPFLNRQNNIGPNPFNMPRYINTDIMNRWMGVEYVEKLAAFCQESIEGYYRQVSISQNQSESLYFAEKFPPSHSQWLMWELYPQAREIILTRDFRDMLSSMIAFNSKRGFLSFGRARVSSDEEFIIKLRSSIAKIHENWMKRKDKALLVKYEDLIHNSEDTLKSILTYLNLEYTPSIIEKMININTNDAEETKRMKQHRTSNDPVNSIGRWKKDLTPAQKAMCEKSFGDLLEKFGYQK
jgi:hypothetical protein